MKKIEPDVLMILRLAVYQLNFLDRVPAHAVVHSAVELTKANVGPRATGFVNGVLRQMLRAPQAPQFSNDARGLAVQYGHPQWLVERYIKAYGFDNANARCLSNNHDAPHHQMNLGERDKVIKIIAEEGGKAVACEHAQMVLVLEHPNPFGSPSFTGTTLGGSKMRRHSSSLTFLTSTRAIWDVCAAPGGKSRRHWP